MQVVLLILNLAFAVINLVFGIYNIDKKKYVLVAVNLFSSAVGFIAVIVILLNIDEF